MFRTSARAVRAYLRADRLIESKLGRVVNIRRYEKQALARFATDGGNNVSIEVYPSASLGVP